MKYDAYYRRMDENAYLQGRYFYEALVSVTSGMFSKKKSDVYEYPDGPRSLQKGKLPATKRMTKEERDRVAQRAILDCY